MTIKLRDFGDWLDKRIEKARERDIYFARRTEENASIETKQHFLEAFNEWRERRVTLMEVKREMEKRRLI